jgi:hypothetical protein
MHWLGTVLSAVAVWLAGNIHGCDKGLELVQTRCMQRPQDIHSGIHSGIGVACGWRCVDKWGRGVKLIAQSDTQLRCCRTRIAGVDYGMIIESTFCHCRDAPRSGCHLGVEEFDDAGVV